MRFPPHRFFRPFALAAALLLASGAGAQTETQKGTQPAAPLVLTGAAVTAALPPAPAATRDGGRRLLLVLDGVRQSEARPALYDLFWLPDPTAREGRFIGTLSLFGLPRPETLPPSQGRTLVFDVTDLAAEGARPALRLVPGPDGGAAAAGRIVIDRIALETSPP